MKFEVVGLCLVLLFGGLVANYFGLFQGDTTTVGLTDDEIHSLINGTDYSDFVNSSDLVHTHVVTYTNATYYILNSSLADLDGTPNPFPVYWSLGSLGFTPDLGECYPAGMLHWTNNTNSGFRYAPCYPFLTVNSTYVTSWYYITNGATGSTWGTMSLLIMRPSVTTNATVTP